MNELPEEMIMVAQRKVDGFRSLKGELDGDMALVEIALETVR